MKYHGIQNTVAISKGEVAMQAGDLFVVEFANGDGFSLFSYEPKDHLKKRSKDNFKQHVRGTRETCEAMAKTLIEKNERNFIS